MYSMYNLHDNNIMYDLISACNMGMGLGSRLLIRIIAIVKSMHDLVSTSNIEKLGMGLGTRLCISWHHHFFMLTRYILFFDKYFVPFLE